MTKKSAFFLTCVLIALSSSAQNWRVFSGSSDTLAFITDSAFLFACIDSTYSQSGKQITFLHYRLGDTPDTLNPPLPNFCIASEAGATHIGRLIIETDSLTLFCFVRDTLPIIHLDSTITDFNGMQLSVFYSGTTFDTIFNGATDSIRNYSVSVLNPAPGLPIGSYTIQFSKHYGLLTFPLILDEFKIFWPLTNFFSGSASRSDIPTFLRHEFFNFSIGDEFHYTYKYGFQSQGGGYPSEQKNSRLVVIQKIIGGAGNTVTYQFAREQQIINTQYGPNYNQTISYNSDSIYQTFYDLKYPISESLPLEYMVNDNGYCILTEADSIKKAYFYGQILFPFAANCLSNLITSSPKTIIYQSYLGRINFVNYSCSGMGGCEVTIDELVYANTTKGIMGMPHAFDIEERSISTSSIYPNPANDILVVKGFSEGTAFLLIDVLGNNMIQGHLESSFAELNISILKPGVYILKIGNQTYKMLKL